jgi:hypothetical protein
MIHTEDAYLDFRTRIRNAETHEEAEEIMRDLTPQAIRKTCKRLLSERGQKTSGYKTGHTFENKEFVVQKYDDGEIILTRKATDLREHPDDDIVFQMKGNRIVRFQPMKCWNILNFLEEIIDKGEIEI